MKERERKGREREREAEPPLQKRGGKREHRLGGGRKSACLSGRGGFRVGLSLIGTGYPSDRTWAADHNRNN